MIQTVLYPGSFDPVTLGHMDIIRRAAAQFPRVLVGVLYNPQKQTGTFSMEERVALLKIATEDIHNVEILPFSGLLVDAAKQLGADAVIRGIRSSADTETEMQMARINRALSGVETFFFAASPDVSHISANYVRDIGRLGGDLSKLVPDTLHERIAQALRNINQP